MSQENVEVVRRGFEAWNAGDRDGVRDAYDPDAVMRYHGDFPEPGPFVGRDAIMRQFDRLREALAERDVLEFVGDVLGAGDRVVSRFAWRGEGYGPAIDMELTVVYTVKAGRILEADFFRDHEKALEAAGLSELAMSQENVEIIAQGADAWTRQDVEAFVATLSPDVEWEDAMFWSEPRRTYRGRQALQEWFVRAIVDPWESIHLEVEEIIDAGEDRVIAGGLLTARGRGSGVETRVRGWSVFWFQSGLITRRRVFLERAEALEAAGLPE